MLKSVCEALLAFSGQQRGTTLLACQEVQCPPMINLSDAFLRPGAMISWMVLLWGKSQCERKREKAVEWDKSLLYEKF